MAGHLIYHWKHGWIPLTHAAALSKAHGSPHLADKYVPGASAHHTSVVTHGRSAREIHSTLTPHTHSTEGEVSKLRAGDHASVRGMDQFGRPMTFTGRVSGKPTPVRIKQGPNGAEHPHLAVSMHNGSDASGMDATARGTVYVKRSPDADVSADRAHTPERGAAAVAALQAAHDAKSRPAAEARVAALAPMTRQGPQYNRAVDNHLASYRDAQRKGDAQSAEHWLQMAEVAAGKRRLEDTNASRESARARQVAELAARARQGDFKDMTDADLHAILNRGVMDPQAYTHVTAELRRRTGAPQVAERPAPTLPERHSGVAYNTLNEAGRRAQAAAQAAHAAPAEKRAKVEHSGDGTLLHLDRNDTEARTAAKAAGFKWSSNLGSWYLPRNWSEPTRRQKIAQLQGALGHDNVHLEDAGHGVTTTAAQREAEARAQAASRAERMDARAQRAATEADVRFGRAKAIGDMIPMGQPILVGHHSQRRHERDLERIDTNMRKGVEAHQEAQAATAAAARARATAAGDSPLARQRRVDRNEAELRKLDRRLSDHNSAQKIQQTAKYQTVSPAVRAAVDRSVLPADYHAQLSARRAQLADEIAHDKAQITASGHTSINLAEVAPGDVIHYRGRAHVVSKVNQKTISVPTGYSWDDKVPANQVTRHTKMADLSEASLKSAFTLAKSNPKLRATILRELNRRGISAADL